MVSSLLMHATRATTFMGLPETTRRSSGISIALATCKFTGNTDWAWAEKQISRRFFATLCIFTINRSVEHKYDRSTDYFGAPKLQYVPQTT
jgi:hypothetical protein